MNMKGTGAAGMLALAMLIAGSPAVAQEEQAGSLAEAISSGEANFGFRYRYEYVNDDNPALVDDTANASVVRLRLNYRTASGGISPPSASSTTSGRSCWTNSTT